MEDYISSSFSPSRNSISTYNNTRFEGIARIVPSVLEMKTRGDKFEIPQVDSSRLALVTTRKRKDGGGHKTGSTIFSRPAKYVESVACSLLQSLAVVTSAAADCREYRTS